MRHARVLAVSALATAVVVAAAAFAQTTLTPLPDNGPINTASLEVDFSKTHWGDAKAGQTKATACAACHGADGNSTVEMYPDRQWPAQFRRGGGDGAVRAEPHPAGHA